MNVRVAHAAASDFNADIVGTDRPTADVHRFERLISGIGAKGLYSHGSVLSLIRSLGGLRKGGQANRGSRSCHDEPCSWIPSRLNGVLSGGVFLVGDQFHPIGVLAV